VLTALFSEEAEKDSIRRLVGRKQERGKYRSGSSQRGVGKTMGKKQIGNPKGDQLGSVYREKDISARGRVELPIKNFSDKKGHALQTRGYTRKGVWIARKKKKSVYE